MTEVILKKATHIFAQPGEVTVTEAEAARLCMLGVAEMKKPEPEAAPEAKKKTTKKAAK